MRGGLTRRVMLASSALVVLIAGAFVGAPARVGQHARLGSARAALARGALRGQPAREARGRPRDRPARVRDHHDTAVPCAVAHGEDSPSRGGETAAQPRWRPRPAPQASRLVRRGQARTSATTRCRWWPRPAAATRRLQSVRTTPAGSGWSTHCGRDFNRYVTTERDLLTARQADADSEAHRATVAASAGLVGSIVLIALFASYLARAIVAADPAGRRDGEPDRRRRAERSDARDRHRRSRDARGHVQQDGRLARREPGRAAGGTPSSRPRYGAWRRSSRATCRPRSCSRASRARWRAYSAVGYDRAVPLRAGRRRHPARRLDTPGHRSSRSPSA